jgi:O-antigen ligase
MTISMMRATHPLAATALLFGPIALFAPKGEVPLLALCCLLTLATAEGRAAARRAFSGPLVWALSALLLWALAAVWWSADPLDALWLWLRVIAWLAAACVLRAAAAEAADPAPLLRALPLGAALGLALAAFEMSAGNPIRSAIEGVHEHVEFYQSYWLNRGMTALLLLLWPAAAVLWPRSRAKAAALLVAGALTLFAGPQMAAKLAFVVALGAAGLAWLAGRRLRAPLVALAFAVSFGMPLAVGLLPPATELQAEHVTSSISHRTQIWTFAVGKIAEEPVAGWGFDASRSIPGGQQIAPGTIANLMPLHPHNGVLQIWLELGGIGAALLALLLAAAFWWAASLPARSARAAACGAVMSALVIGCVSYGVWQTQWLAVLGLLAAFLAAAARAVESCYPSRPCAA